MPLQHRCLQHPAACFEQINAARHANLHIRKPCVHLFRRNQLALQIVDLQFCRGGWHVAQIHIHHAACGLPYTECAAGECGAENWGEVAGGEGFATNGGGKHQFSHSHSVYGGNAHNCVVAREWQPNSGCANGRRIRSILLFSPYWAGKRKNSQERFLRNFNRTYVFHTLFAFFLLFQEFAFAGDVTAVAFC